MWCKLCGAPYAVTSVWCNLCCGLYVIPPMWCHLCGALYVVQYMWCTRCCATLPSWGPLGCLLGPLKGLFGTSWGPRGVSWVLLGAEGSKCPFGSPVGTPSWSRLGSHGAVLEALWAVLRPPGQSWAPYCLERIALRGTSARRLGEQAHGAVRPAGLAQHASSP